MSKHLATVAKKNFLLTGRTLCTDPGSEVGGHLMRPAGVKGRERVREKKREKKRDKGRGREREGEMEMHRNNYTRNTETVEM